MQLSPINKIAINKSTQKARDYSINHLKAISMLNWHKDQWIYNKLSIQYLKKSASHIGINILNAQLDKKQSIESNKYFKKYKMQMRRYKLKS